ncbi:uncharacterized protein BT62DRAFT_1004641 [Guyanagaster necrorhizus]|uniref:Uncharacterized protein n=1 Tax=Guyanagaster necrorhizus TaxID=856835 RepID=A0A9P7VV07_9AGAR|nr:uncharacterized protein BT62DRAFT_1004641 [Guyanagaster necrorhizus MCA 3950]KAG7447868.1 hypothetical protein BT62DRAFT_1004641 [Guyanagaster necrorhizus MCA 3950]
MSTRFLRHVHTDRPSLVCINSYISNVPSSHSQLRHVGTLFMAEKHCSTRALRVIQPYISERTLLLGPGYRGGTRKGLDLTISGITPTESRYFPSSSHPDSYGGVLLRTLRDLNSGKIISGPSLLVDHILQLRRVEIIPQSPCISLDLSHPVATASSTHPRVGFISRPYRYFVHPERLTANGRAQTLLGVLPQKELSGLKDKTLNAYLAEYQAGIDRKAKLEELMGARQRGISSSPTKYMKLMGCIEYLKAVKSAAGDDDGAN